MKKTRTVTSLLLSFALIISVYVPGAVSRAEEVGKDFIGCEVHINTPYLEYFDGCTNVELDASDLKDDFGIGLPTDGSDAPVAGSENFTAIRAIAKQIRNCIMGTEKITDPAEANKKMKDHIDYSNGFINSIRPVEKDRPWNAGAFSDVTVTGSAVDGYWGLFVDNMYSADKGVAEVSLGSMNYGTRIDLTWISFTAKDGNPYAESASVGLIDDKEYHGYAQAGKKTNLRVMELLFDPVTFSYSSQYTPVSGAAVDVFDDTDELIYSTETDAAGKFSLDKTFESGSYTIRAWKEAKNAAGETYSRMTFSEISLVLVKKPGTPKNVKVKKNGKKVIVTWKALKDASDYYEVYSAGKKNGKYKLAASVIGTKAKIKKAKAGKYIKVRHYYAYEYGPEGTDHIRFFYGKFSSPVKVK
ncbi:MAG: carboxypeptidase regulatory-like domain-containing protein [Eubacterium sp.]|nr:carboxypeptidase regulatory-like domain-containing protein [Eubacterium sp.]